MKPFTLFYGRFPRACEKKLNGVTGKTPNGKYIVWINTEMDEATQAHTLRHELAHLHFRHSEKTDYEEHFERYEREANEYADKMTGEELEYLLSFCTGKKTIPEGMLAAFDLAYKPA